MKTTRFLSAAIFGFAVAFTFSCSSGGGDDDSGGQGSSFNVNPQIYNEDGTLYKGSGLLDVTHHVRNGGSSDSEWDHIRAGSVTNGVVNLELDKVIPDDEYLEDFSKVFGYGGDCPDLKGLKVAGGFFVLTNNNGEYIGTMNIRYRDEQIQEEIFYMYFSETRKITCGGSTENIKKGWNKIYRVIDRVAGRREDSTNNILTKEVKWIFRYK